MTNPKDQQRRQMERAFTEISPFEFKNKLISLAKWNEKKSTRAMLDAGRGNPNWIATTPREAFFTLGHFALLESRRVWTEPDLAGKPQKDGMAIRLEMYLQDNPRAPGGQLIKQTMAYGIGTHDFDPDEWVYELVDGIIGDNYPMPDRMLVHVERIVHDFLQKVLCQHSSACGNYDLFAVEGATAAMCYIFDSLLANHLLSQGDKIGIMVPIFPPYIEIPRLSRYDFEVVEIKATAINERGQRTWQYPPVELAKLADPSIKALFLVNPSNPPSVAIQPETIQALTRLVKEDNPNLMIISDDVYGTFVDNYQSLMAELPYNTIGVYSFSKYFGVTGWRLGVIAVNQDNVFDYLLRHLPTDQAEVLDERYESLTQRPDKLSFINRLVADSRQVALNHTAGLSTPQQVQMAFLCTFALLDAEQNYQALTKSICRRRMKLLYDGLGLPQPELPYAAYYYTEFDLDEWSSQHYGADFTEFLHKNYEPVDILFRLAENSSIVLLNGGGFHGPVWSIRVSLANLDDADYAQIGQELDKTLAQYVQEWQASLT